VARMVEVHTITTTIIPRDRDMRYSRALLLVFLTMTCMTACTKFKLDDTERKKTKVEPKMTTTYQVGNLQGGSFTPLGTLSFNESNDVELNIETKGPAAEELRKVVAEIADKEKLDVKRSVESENKVSYVGVEVDKSSDEYPRAVIDYLSSRHGFFVTPLAEAN
jgi:hypothetical protein